MLATPTKLHYSFDTTDLSRVWQGMMHATSAVVQDAGDVLALWKHECCRVIADRYSTVGYNTTISIRDTTRFADITCYQCITY